MRLPDPCLLCGTSHQVCRDKNGLFFTGDTCQTIARGVGFRFEELTTMFHHVRTKQLSELAAAGRQLDDLPRHLRVRVPEINKLAIKRVLGTSNTESPAHRSLGHELATLCSATHLLSYPLAQPPTS